ncbi:hypothetical protein RYX36_022299, partial [Vicia faba]
NTQVPAMPISITCIKPDLVVGLSKQYDAVNGSNEQKNVDASGVPPTIPPSKNIAKHGHNTMVYNNEEVAKERKNSQDDLKSTKENGPQNMDRD